MQTKNCADGFLVQFDVEAHNTHTILRQLRHPFIITQHACG